MDHPVPYIRYVGWILVIDCFTALYFARLRFANKAWLFALYKSVKILSEVGFNLILFFFIPSYLTGHPDSMLLNFIPAQPDYGYILFAILLSGIVSLFLFIPQIIRTKIQFKKEQWKQIMLYSLPLMIAGLPGVANDYVDRILFRYFSPSGTSWLDQLGIYSAVTKLAVFITLFVQMFRYAAEPFFFASSENENIKITYARVMKYFVAFCMVLFLGIAFYADIFALILGKEYRGGMGVLPLVLMANILLGVTFNLSMWYKMSDKTQYAIYITLLGLAVTVVLNIVFMPVYGYWAAAWSRLLSYVVMIFFSYLLSIRNFPIPYDLRSIFTYFVVGIGLFGLSLVPSQQPVWIRLTINSILMMSFIVFIFRYEHLKPGMIVEVKKIVIRKKAGNKHGS
jgi:O-antigen/teichoic acid export membrane protein